MATLDLSPENVKARFQELSVESNILLEQLQPLWEELGTIVDGTADLSLSAAQAREAELRQQIRDLQNQRAPVEQERSQLAGLLVDRNTGLAQTGPIDDSLTALRDTASDD